jgi:signal transduction histidine kinase
VFDQWLEPAIVTEVGLYRIAQEALNNALKHAAATAVTVKLHSDGAWVELDVTDNGQGFAPDTVTESGGMGLTTMRQRAQRLGGTLTVQSIAGQGTTVSVKVKTGKIGEKDHDQRNRYSYSPG